MGVRCEVIAPSKTPRASGEKVKSDRKDTEHLLRQLMAGALTPIAVPTESAEAARDLVRAREQVRGDLMRCRHRLSKLLLRHGRVWDASTWTKAHERWLGSQRFEQVNTELAYIATHSPPARASPHAVSRSTSVSLRSRARLSSGRPSAGCARLRGIDTLSALVIALEVGDFQRFDRAVQLGSWLGLVPSRQQSGETDTHGPITKTGSRYARRILVEAAWHYLRQPSVGVTLASRHEGLPDHILQIAWRAQHRLHRVHRRLRAHKKPPNVVNVAVARELACFIWAAATA